jgi:hypothetical protein
MRTVSDILRRQHKKIAIRSGCISQRLPMSCVICSPHTYYAEDFQAFMARECQAANSRWIYDIIDGKCCPRREQIFLREREWCLCAYHHAGADSRYLVIFNDTKLRTIRDLRACHLRLLAEVKAKVSAWLSHRHAERFHMFFHYMPSVFQLHLHVSSAVQFINSSRAHFLLRVIRNLQQNSEYYAQALILTVACRTLKRAETHERVKAAI